MEWRRGVFEEAPWARRFWTQREYNWAPILWVRSSRCPCEVVLTVDTPSSRSGWPVILWNTSSTKRCHYTLPHPLEVNAAPQYKVGQLVAGGVRRSLNNRPAPTGLGHNQGKHPHKVFLETQDQRLLSEILARGNLRESMRSSLRGDEPPALASGLEEVGEETGHADQPEQLVQAAQHRHNKQI